MSAPESLTAALPLSSAARSLRQTATPAAAALLMALSGFAALACQLVWTQQLGTWLGHEIAAVLAVIAAFFGGLALGAHTLGRRAAASRHPGRWWAALEAAIGLWTLLLVLLMAPAGALLARLIGADPSPLWHWAVAFGGTFALLLPATAAMGATLPAVERVVDRLRDEGYGIGALYAANTLGAVAGVLVAAFWAVPALGLAGSARLAAAGSLMCALGAFVIARPSAAPTAQAPAGADRSAQRRLLVLLAATGLLGIGYEVLVVRVLSQLAENTVYTYAMLLAVYLLGTAAGAAAYQRWGAGRADAERLQRGLLLALAAAVLAGTAVLWPAAGVKTGVQAALAEPLHSGLAAALAGEAALALAAFTLPTLLMGALFSHLCVQARAAGLTLGTALAVNTLGAALAPLLFGVLLLPLLGPKLLLALLVPGYLLLLLRGWPLRPVGRIWPAGPAWPAWPAWPLLGGAAALALLGPPLAFVDLPEGGRVLRHQDGVMAAVSVVQDAQGVVRLHINNRQQEGGTDGFLTDARQAWLPRLLHPAPKNALFLGLGTGTTAAAAAIDPQLRVTAVELLPEVIAAAPHFVPALLDPAAVPNLQLRTGDARRFVRSDGPRYDLVVADLFHPARSGAGALYTVEHFRAVGARLAPGGVFCQWLPLHQLDLDTLRSIVASFVQVFPGAQAVLVTNSLYTPVIGLVARPGVAGFDLQALRAGLTRAATLPRVATLALADEYAVLGSVVASPAALQRFAAGSAANTDDRPRVVYSAPRLTYAPDSLPSERLLALLRDWQPDADALLGPDADPAVRQRLQAYWQARQRYIELGVGVRPGSSLAALLAQVQAPMLELLRTSPDFRPAYDPLLSMAQALSRQDAAAARTLLQALADAVPARPEAALLLRQWGAGP